jgi:HK97 family phage portal protein
MGRPMDSETTPVPAKLDRSLDLLCGDRPRTYEGDGPAAWNGPVSVGDAAGLMRFLGIKSDEFSYVSAADALRQSAVLACLDIRAQDIAAAPLTLNRVLTQGSRRRGYEAVAPRAHYLARLFWDRPNRFMTWWEFTTMVVYHLGLLSNAYIIPIRNRLLQTTELIPVLPTRVRMDVVTGGPLNGQVFYRIQASNAAEAAQYGSDEEIILFADQIIHIKTRMLNGFSGLPTLMVGNRVMALTEAVSRFQSRIFGRDGTLRGVFQQAKESPELSQVQYDRLKSSLGEALNLLRDMGYPLVLEGGMEFKAISMTAAEAGAKEAFAQQVEEVARLFRIPPHKLMHFAGVKYDNLEPLERQYVTDSLIRPACNPIEERLCLALLTEDEQPDYYIEFDRKALHQADQKALSERVTKQWQLGLVMRDEAREELGYNPAPGDAGRVFFMPANSFLLDGNNEVVVTNQPSPGDPGPSGDSGQQNDETGKPPQE